MICVDSLKPQPGSPKWKYGKSCHLFSDDATIQGINDLHKFAIGIGLMWGWFHEEHIPNLPHYDLTEGKRKYAIKCGAREVDDKFVVEVMNKWREK